MLKFGIWLKIWGEGVAEMIMPESPKIFFFILLDVEILRGKGI